MKFPNKVINYKQSLLSKFPIILKVIKNENISVNKLYNKTKSKFEDIAEFVEVLDCLFALNKINIDEAIGVLYYVE